MFVSHSFVFICQHLRVHQLVLNAVQETFIGNYDQDTTKINYYANPVNAYYIRIYPTKHEIGPCLRFELLGAEGITLHYLHYIQL